MDFITALKTNGTRLSHLAAAMSVNKATVTRWAQHRVPAERVLDVERITGISRHVIRPDIYPAPKKRGASQ